MNTRLAFALCTLVIAGCRADPAPTPIIATPEEPPATQGAEREVKPPTIGVARPATPEERQAVEKLAKAAESIRQLRFERPITIEIEDDEAIAESLRSQIDAEELERAHVLYGALGLIDPSEDLEELFSGVLGEQVIGYYDPESSRLVIRDDIMRGLRGTLGPGETEEARLVLVHELVHALQDQRLGLAEAYDKERTTDADNAYRAVVEGDATLAMLGNALRGQGIPLSAATQGIQQMGSFLDVSAFVQGDKLDDAPAIIRITLVAPYFRGLQFVSAMHAIGGWPSVNRAHRRPPTTSEQILHPDKYSNAELGEPFEVPPIPALDKAGFERIVEDTIGELEMGVYLGQDRKSGTNEAAAAGWGGDHIAIYERAGEHAVVWWTTWDTVHDAAEAAAAAKRVAPRNAKSAVVQNGRAVLIVRDLPPRLHAAVRKVFGKFAERINAGRPPGRTRPEAQ